MDRQADVWGRAGVLGTMGLVVGMAIVVMGTTGCERMRRGSIGEHELAGSQPADVQPAVTGLQPVPRLTEERVREMEVAAVAPGSATVNEQGGGEPEGRGFVDVHFGFDSWRLSEVGRREVTRNAEWVRAHPRRRVRIEGHADERGTRAYNLVLGERRAKAVQSYLIDLGVSPERLAVVSYGRERPVCREASEACWWRNRRAHLGWEDAGAAGEP